MKSTHFSPCVMGLSIVCLFWTCVTAFAQPPIVNDSGQNEPAAGPSLWYGELDAGPRVFRFLIAVTPSESADLQPKAVLTSRDEGNASFVLDEFRMVDSTMQFRLKATRATYEGTVDQDGQLIAGTWKQGVELKLDFKKVLQPPVDEPQETWRGELKAGFQTLNVQLRGYAPTSAPNSEGGDTRFFFDSLSQKAGGFKAKLENKDGEVHIDVPAIGAKYVGKRNTEGTEIVGKWKQVASIDLTWKRQESVADPSPIARRRPQIPKPPFPYEVREVTFRNEAEGITLAGTLTLPEGIAACPLAILISGSGPQDRDETILGHQPFWVLADHLTRNGIAVLRYDERGVGKSTGDFGRATSADFANDVVAAVAYARTLSEVDPQRVGLIGHSEGGLIAPMVASDDPKIAWIVLMAAPGVNGEDILYSQGQLMVKAEGGSVEAQAKQLQLQKSAFKSLKDSDRSRTQSELIESIVDEILAGEADAATVEREPLKALIRLNLIEMEKPWFKYFAAHEPGPVLEKVRCPVLALNGSLDTQVDPKLNLPKIEEHLQAGGNMHYVLRELPKLNHLFQTCTTGGISEYEQIEETISPIALNAISDWIGSLP